MKIIFTILFVFIVWSIQAQQGLQMEFTEKDSAQIKLEREIQYRQLISGTLNSEFVSEKLELPDFNFNNEMQSRYTLNIDVIPFNSTSFGMYSTDMGPLFHSPIYVYGRVLSSARYALSDKFAVGGYSFGANSIFSAPPPIQGMNNFDTHGSTIFMQYKVSKKFKIETRISVTQDHGNRF